jgi:hypothetical protein
MKTHTIELTPEQLNEVRSILSSAIEGAREDSDREWSKSKVQFLKGIKSALQPLMNYQAAS